MEPRDYHFEGLETTLSSIADDPDVDVRAKIILQNKINSIRRKKEGHAMKIHNVLYQTLSTICERIFVMGRFDRTTKPAYHIHSFLSEEFRYRDESCDSYRIQREIANILHKENSFINTATLQILTRVLIGDGWELKMYVIRDFHSFEHDFISGKREFNGDDRVARWGEQAAYRLMKHEFSGDVDRFQEQMAIITMIF